MYHYMMTTANDARELQLSASPDEIIQFISNGFELFGFNQENTAFLIWVSEDESVWRPIFGTDDTEPTLFPLMAVSERMKGLTDEECYAIGKKALSAYNTIRKRWLNYQITQKSNKALSEALDDMRKQMLGVESVVAGTEYEVLFDLKYKQRKKNYYCAAEFNVGQRTVDRMIEQMTMRIGYILHLSMKPRQLQELLEWPERYERQG